MTKRQKLELNTLIKFRQDQIDNDTIYGIKVSELNEIEAKALLCDLMYHIRYFQGYFLDIDKNE